MASAMLRDHEGGRALEVEAVLSELFVGRVILVYYSDDPNVYHERLLLWPAGGFRNVGYWAIVTPDFAIYVEDISAQSPADGPSRMCLMNENLDKPMRLRGQIYRFAEKWTKTQMCAWIRAGRRAVTDEGMELGVAPQEVRLHDGTMVPMGSVCPAGVVEIVVAGKNTGANTPPKRAKEVDKSGSRHRMGTPSKVDGSMKFDLEAGTGFKWIAGESAKGVEKGDTLELVDGDLRMGDRALFCTDLGDTIWAKRVKDDDKGDDKGGDDPLDARVLTPLSYDHEGNRHIEFAEAVRLMKQEPSKDFPLKGGRSLSWLLRYIVEHGGTPDGRHTKWAVEQKVDRDTAAYHIHDLLGLALEVGACWDQLDMPNVAAMEVIGRLYQLTEETSGTMKMEGLEHFVGRDVAGSLKRGVAFAPGLAKYTTDQLSAQTGILKERRKAREEFAAAKAKSDSK